MYYLSAYNRDLFKSYYFYVSLYPFKKFFKYYENIIYIYLKKNYLVSKYRKNMCHRENKSLFFEVMKNGQFFSKL